MDDILKDSGSEVSTNPIELGDLIETRPLSPSIPLSAVRNRASTSAILSADPDAMMEKYRLLMQEGQEGTSVTHDQVMAALEEQNKTKSMKHVVNVLADPKIPLDQKKRLMTFVQTGGFKEDPANTLRTKGLENASEGEDLRGEAARISLADTMNVLNIEAQNRQKMVNGLMATHAAADAGTVGDMAAAEVMPFGRNIIGAKVAAKIDELDGKTTSVGAWVKNFLLPGTTKQNIQDRLMSIPPAKRDEMTAKLIASIKESASVFHSDDYYSQYITATRLLDSPSHSNAEVWTENIMTLLDGFWVASEVKALTKAGKVVRETPSAAGSADDVVQKANWELVPDPSNPFAPKLSNPQPKLEYKRADTAKRLELNSVVRQENPVAPFSVMEQVNPSAARAMHEAIVSSGSDELAQALTGVNAEQAIANNILPQVGTESGSVLNKVDQTIKDAITNTGATRYTTDEFNSAVDAVKRDFRNASGLQINDAMSTFRVDGDHMLIDGHYSTVGGSFVTPEAARAQAEYALRSYGIRPDEIKIMKREGMDYVPVGPEDTKPGDYIIKVNTKHAIDDSEVGTWNNLDVKRNITDRVSQTMSNDKGSLAGWVFDPPSMLHPTITGSASIAADQAVALENLFLKPIKEFRNSVGKFDKARQAKIEDYIKEANTNGIKMDNFDLTARGFQPAEVAALNKWKEIWDTHFYLENYDLVRSLNSQGYNLLESKGTKLFAKPVPKNQNIGAVLDAQTGKVEHYTQAQMDTLYNTNGYYAKLRRPIQVSGQDVEHVIVRNSPQEYLRKIRDTDEVLNYREGYYTVSYNRGSKFIDEITMVAGKEVRKTVAVAGNTADAKMFAESQQAATGNKYMVREDTRGFTKDGDGYWDVNSASGRVAQRHRGQPLETAKGVNQLGSGVYVDNPMESAARAARSVAGRTIGRPMIDTAWTRFAKQYEDLLPSNGMGGKRIPTSLSEIVDHGSHTSKRVGDARTTFQYIKYLEDGYINTADQIFKGGMNMVADMLGNMGLSKMENVAQAVGNVSPSHLAKSVVFNAYIVGSNPIRQWIVQSHQATRMAAYNPIGIINGGVGARIAGYIGEHTGLDIGSKLVKDFAKFVDDSGMVAGVDRNSLVRGMKLSMADSSSKVKRRIGTVASFPQVVGFDIGEKMNQIGHLAAVHEKWSRQGVDLATDKTARDLALTEARALSYDLNKAGELTYTQSSPAMILQFLQMPHKALLQLSNRKLPADVRLRLAAFDLVMFGVGAGTFGGIIAATVGALGGDGNDVLPDDPELRDMYLYGMEAFYLNKMFSVMDDSGDNTRIDFSALAPNDMEGWARMYHSFMDKGAMATIASSPAGQLMAIDGVMGSKRNGRIPNAVLSLARYFNVIEEVDPENPREFSSVMNEVFKISSGWTAAENARLMLETRKKFDGSGVKLDDYVTVPEAWAQGLGFGTLSTKELYTISQKMDKDSKRHQESVMSRYRDILAYYKDTLGEQNGDAEHVQKVTSMLMRTFDPADRQIVMKQWKQDMMGKESALLKKMMTASGIVDSQGFQDNIKMSNQPPEVKELLLNRFKDMKALDARNKQKKED